MEIPKKPPIEGADLDDVIYAINNVREEVGNLAKELKRIAKLLEELPGNLERT